MKQKGFTTFSLHERGLAPILIVLLIALAVGGYFVYQQQAKTTLPTPSPTQTTIQPSPSPTAASPLPNGAGASGAPTGDAETANWKTYTTDKFAFKYPQNYVVKESYKGSYAIYLDKSPIDTHTVIGIDATLSNVYSNYDKAVELEKTYYKDSRIEDIPNGIKITGKQAGGYGAGVLHKVILIKYKQGAVHIEAADPDQDTSKIYDQILSTFKFQ